MTRQRPDIDYDGAGQPCYTNGAVGYIQEHADRIGLSFDDTAELYEQNHNLGRFDDNEFVETVSPETAARMNAITRDPGLLGRDFHEQFNRIFGASP